MAMAGYAFDVKVSRKEERCSSTKPDEMVRELSLLKAEDVAGQEEKRDLVIIGADTVVAHRGAVLGKPRSREDAFQMIRSFQGEKHQVYTGVTILHYDAEGKRTCITHAEKTDVYVNPMTDEEIWAYIEKDNVMDKAGAYGIQSGFAVHVGRIEGDYFNIVGLTVAYVYETLKRFAPPPGRPAGQDQPAGGDRKPDLL